MHRRQNAPVSSAPDEKPQHASFDVSGGAGSPDDLSTSKHRHGFSSAPLGPATFVTRGEAASFAVVDRPPWRRRRRRR
jgi:hypothetical protein